MEQTIKTDNQFFDVQPDSKSEERLFEGKRNHGKFNTLTISGIGNLGFRADEQGMWFGDQNFASSPARIGMDGSNNITTGGNFTDLGDVPSSYVAADANKILKVNNAYNAIEFSNLTVTTVANSFYFDNGTAYIDMNAGAGISMADSSELALGTGINLDVTANCTINQNLQTTADVTFNSVSGFFLPPSSSDASAPNNSVYYSTKSSKLVYKDSGGTPHDLY